VSLIGDAPFSLVPKFSSSASERACCSGQQSGLRHSAKYSFAVYARVDQSVTECYDLVVGRVRQFPPSKAARPSSCPYSPKCVEQKFCELRGSKVAISATRRGGRRWIRVPVREGHDPRAEISGIWKSVASRHCMRTDERALKASYSPKCVEKEFCELRLLGILRTSP
jgi:hypothetical protein